MNKWTEALLLLFFLLRPVFALAGSPDTDFEDLKQRYFSLRNTDTEVRRADDWRDLAANLRNFANSNPSSSHSPEALLYASILELQAGKAGNDGALSSEGEQQLEDLVRRYPASDLADDALLVLARTKEAPAAAEYYARIIEKYPNSDSAEFARSLLELEKTPATGARNGSVSPSPGREGTLVVLDPGHGGEDRGAVGPASLFEKDVTLVVALETADLLEEEGLDVFLSRDTDSFVPLADRVAMANSEGGAVFVSLHVNASGNGRRTGLETYVLSKSIDEAGRLLAQRENSASGGGEPGDVQFIVGDLIQKGKLRSSEQLARMLEDSIAGALRKNRYHVADNGVKKGPFYVLVGTHMPSVLIEMGYIDSEKEVDLLADGEFRKTLARGIAEGIRSFLEAEKK